MMNCPISITEEGRSGRMNSAVYGTCSRVLLYVMVSLYACALSAMTQAEIEERKKSLREEVVDLTRKMHRYSARDAQEKPDVRARLQPLHDALALLTNPAVSPDLHEDILFALEHGIPLSIAHEPA